MPRRVEHLIVGGGLAGGNCARWLREEGAEGDVLIVGREPDPPYDRPPCSKGFLAGRETREDMLFRPDEWWREQRIELMTRVSVTGLDAGARTATLSSGEELSFGTALLATGSNVRRLPVEGGELEGVHYLRTLRNSEAIREAVQGGGPVVCVGGSYIGCEVAASVRSAYGCDVAIVMQEAVTLSRGFGETAGRFLQERLTEHGIEIHGEDEIERFEGEDGHVTAVVTRSGHRLPASTVVMGVGVTPEVSLAGPAGLELADDGGVRCDSMLRTSADGVFAAGDIASYESPVHGRRLRVEHWDVAFNQGKTAALNMLGREVAHEVVPYFFSDLADWASLEYVGPAASWDEEVVRGSIADGEFSVFYLDGGRVAAALAIGRGDDLDHARRLMAAGTDVALTGGSARLGDLSTDLSSV